MATYFERIDSLVGIHLAPGGPETVCGQLLNLRQDVSLKFHVQAAVVLIEIVLELVVAEFVSWFEFPVVLGLLLHGVIRQVHHPIR